MALLEAWHTVAVSVMVEVDVGRDPDRDRPDLDRGEAGSGSPRRQAARAMTDDALAEAGRVIMEITLDRVSSANSITQSA